MPDNPVGGHAPFRAFLLSVLLVTSLPPIRPAGQVIAQVARLGMVLALFLVGLSLDRQTLRQVSGRSLVLGVALWLILALGTLLYFK